MSQENPQNVIDTHIHLFNWDKCSYIWPVEMEKFFNRPEGSLNSNKWTLDYFNKVIKKDPKFNVQKVLLMECSYMDSQDHDVKQRNCIAEAKWMNQLCEESDLFFGFMPQIWVDQGRQFVENYQNELRDEHGNLSKYFKGGRTVLMGQPLDHCIQDKYQEGLEVLEQNGIIWEICIFVPHFPNVIKMVQSRPNMKFNQNHCGCNHVGEYDHHWIEFKKGIKELASYQNVTCKLGGHQEWMVSPIPFIKFCLEQFGWDRCIAESNWFVSEGIGHEYSDVFKYIMQACDDLGATQEQKDMVFVNNAIKFYDL